MLRQISSGTRGESVITKPWSPIRHDIASSESSITREPDATSRRWLGEEGSPTDATSAAAPSANRALATIRPNPSRTGDEGCTSRARRAARRRGILIQERACDSQAVEQSVAAHEADVGARDLAVEPQVLDQRDVETWRVEAAARDRHQMSHAIGRDAGVAECVLCRGERQRDRLGLIAAHAILRSSGSSRRRTTGGWRDRLRTYRSTTLCRVFTPAFAVDALEEPALDFGLAGVLLGDLGGVLLANPVGRNGGSDPGDQDGHVQLAVE